MGSLQKNRREPGGSILKLRGGFLNLAIRFQWHLSGGTIESKWTWTWSAESRISLVIHG